MNDLPKMILFDFGGTLTTEQYFDNYHGLKKAFEDAGYDISDLLLRKMSDKLSFFLKLQWNFVRNSMLNFLIQKYFVQSCYRKD